MIITQHHDDECVHELNLLDATHDMFNCKVASHITVRIQTFSDYFNEANMEEAVFIVTA